MEKEIFSALADIYNNKDNKDRYGQTVVFNFREGVLKSKLSEDAFNFLSEGNSVYGKFSTYGGILGVYKALTLSTQFYKQISVLEDTSL